MSSCRKPEIQNDLPKITKIKWICYYFYKNSGQKFLTMFISSCWNNHLIEFLKIGKLKKSYAFAGIRTRNPWVSGYGTPAQRKLPQTSLTKKTIMLTILCRHAHSDWQSTEAFLYVIGKSNIMQTWKYICVLNIKGKHNFKHVYYIHIVETPIQKGEHSWTCTELSL